MPDPKPSGHRPFDLKSLFDTPQKARITVLCALVALATLAAVAVYLIYALRGPAEAGPLPSPGQWASPAPSAAPEEPSAPLDSHPAGLFPALTLEEGRAIALADAGLEEGQAQISREALEEDNGIWVYAFRFQTEEARYEYMVNANTGEIRAKVKEDLAAAGAGPSQAPEPSPSPESAPPEASAVPQPSPAPEPQPSAQPSQSQPPSPGPSPSSGPSTSKYIGMDRAKSIALDHAGAAAGQAVFTRAGMGRVDGRMVYRLGFRQDGVRYSYAVDASTGRILEHTREGP